MLKRTFITMLAAMHLLTTTSHGTIFHLIDLFEGRDLDKSPLTAPHPFEAFDQSLLDMIQTMMFPYLIDDAISFLTNSSRPNYLTAHQHGDAVWTCQFSPSGTLILTVSKDGSVIVHETASFSQLKNYYYPFSAATCGCFHPIEPTIFLGYPDGAIERRPIEGDEAFVEHNLESSIYDLVPTVDGTHILAACNDGHIRKLACTEGQEAGVFTREDFQSLHPTVDRNKKYVAAGIRDGNILLWNFATQELLYDIRAHESTVTCLDFHPSSKHLLSASTDGSIQGWDCETGELIGTLIIEGTQFSIVRFNRKGDCFLTGMSTGEVDVWSFPQGTHLYRCTHNITVECTDAHFHPTEDSILAGFKNGAVLLWKQNEMPDLRRTIRWHMTYAGQLLLELFKRATRDGIPLSPNDLTTTYATYLEFGFTENPHTSAITELKAVYAEMPEVVQDLLKATWELEAGLWNMDE